MKQKYQNFLQKIENFALKQLKDMVAINSYTKNKKGVNALGQLCAHLFQSLNFQPKFVPSIEKNCGQHLFLSRPGNTPHNILLLSHLDTVYPPEEEQTSNFSWKEEGDRIYGPGVADIKGGTILIYMILKTLQETAPKLLDSIHWHILLNATEEEGAEDFPLLARKYANPHSLACLVYEPSYLQNQTSDVVTSRLGAGRIKIESFGRQAHSGSNHIKGANAICALAQTIPPISKLTNYPKQITINVGRIQGGIAINRVPDYAYCEIDIRTPNWKEYTHTLQQIQNICNQTNVYSPYDQFRCKLKLQYLPSYPPWPENPSSQQLGKIFQQTAQELGLPLQCLQRKGASDGCHLWDLTPTLDGLGPIGNNLHCSLHIPEEGKEPEYVLKSSFTPRALLNLHAIEKIVQGATPL